MKARTMTDDEVADFERRMASMFAPLSTDLEWVPGHLAKGDCVLIAWDEAPPRRWYDGLLWWLGFKRYA